MSRAIIRFSESEHSALSRLTIPELTSCKHRFVLVLRAGPISWARRCERFAKETIKYVLWPNTRGREIRNPWKRLKWKFFRLRRSFALRTDEGFVMYLDTSDAIVSKDIYLEGVYNPVWERGMLALAKKLLQPGCQFVDVGANIGWYTLLSAQAGARVHAFEPEPRSGSLLKRSIQANDFQNVEFHNTAVSDKVGEVKLYLSDNGNKGRHSIVWTKDKSIVVNSITLDSMFGEETIDVLKVDVEGAEPLVLDGARSLIEMRRVRNILMEWNPDSWRDMSVLRDFEAYDAETMAPFTFPNKQRNVYFRLRG